MKKINVEKITPYTGGESKSAQIERAFDQIAPHYDFMNRLLSVGIDISWRRRALNSLAAMNPGQILDVATGTGDLAISLAAKFPGAAITALDLSQKMLQAAQVKARRKGVAGQIEFLQGDALAMPFPDATFELATIGFGLRNFENIDAGCCEMHRVLKLGGTLLVLELSRPQAKILSRGYNFYLSRVIPLLGRTFAGCEAEYTYLPASIKEVPQGEAMLAILSRAGFSNCRVKRYACGLCSCYTATAG